MVGDIKIKGKRRVLVSPWKISLRFSLLFSPKKSLKNVTY